MVRSAQRIQGTATIGEIRATVARVSAAHPGRRRGETPALDRPATRRPAVANIPPGRYRPPVTTAPPSPDPRPSPPRGQARAALLGAAEALVREVGFAQLSVERVAARAGVSKGAFFHHFASRQAMVHALLSHLAARFEVDVEARMGAGAGSFTRALVDHVVHEAEHDGAFMAAMMSAVLLDPSAAAVIDAELCDWTARMRAEGVDEATALTVRSVLDGVVLLCLLHAPGPVPVRELRLIRARVLALLDSPFQFDETVA